MLTSLHILCKATPSIAQMFPVDNSHEPGEALLPLRGMNHIKTNKKGPQSAAHAARQDISTSCNPTSTENMSLLLAIPHPQTLIGALDFSRLLLTKRILEVNGSHCCGCICPHLPLQAMRRRGLPTRSITSASNRSTPPLNPSCCRRVLSDHHIRVPASNLV